MPGTSSQRRHLLLVAGAGRSGTSLVTGLVGRLGYHIPVPEVSADESNPKGFGEPRWAVDFHNDLLRSVNVAPEDGRPEAWDIAADVASRPAARERLHEWLQEQFATTDRVVVKDPRLTWFLDLHLAVAGEMSVTASVLTMLRDPAESVKSRELAYGTKSTPTTRMASWLNMMLGLEQRTRAVPRAYVSYDGLMADWRGSLGAAEEASGVPLLSGATAEQEADADELVDASLRRAQSDWDALGLAPDLRDLAHRSWTALQSLGTTQPAAPAELDQLEADYRTMYDAAAELTRSRVRAARVEERRKAARVEREAQPTRPVWRRVLGR
ncbi:sulfotransferase family protein [Microbacterium sp.]|uniref:sulfotransferase family protein n=1 Tax=Microbacterium sp. TaxID=51671 RepID=UPI003734D471